MQLTRISTSRFSSICKFDSANDGAIDMIISGSLCSRLFYLDKSETASRNGLKLTKLNKTTDQE